MKDIKTKQKVSKKIKQRQREDKLFLSRPNQSIHRIKCLDKNTKDDNNSENYAVKKVIDKEAKTGHETLFYMNAAYKINKNIKDRKRKMTAKENDGIAKDIQQSNDVVVKKNKECLMKDQVINRNKMISNDTMRNSVDKPELHRQTTANEKVDKINVKKRRVTIKTKTNTHKLKVYGRKTKNINAENNAIFNMHKKWQHERIKENSHKVLSAIRGAVSKTASHLKTSVHKIIGFLSFGACIISLILFMGIFLVFADNETIEVHKEPVSAEVREYRNVIKKYAEQYDVEQFINLIQAVMMQESNGKGNDPMQSSESIFNEKFPRVKNGITDPDYSIEVGIKSLAECLKKAEAKNSGDTKQIYLALQGYNFGDMYIDWAVYNFGGYTRANATVFAEEMRLKLKSESFGDPDYVPHVLRYYHIGMSEIVQIAHSQIGNVGGQPYWSWYGYTQRVEWCACFVSWVCNEAGLIDMGVVPKFSNCQQGIKWFKEHNQWESKGKNAPQSGYIIFFDFNLDGISDHVGIVDKVEGNTIHTIEGNSIGDVCRQQTYNLKSSYIIGYGITE